MGGCPNRWRRVLSRGGATEVVPRRDRVAERVGLSRSRAVLGPVPCRESGLPWARGPRGALAQPWAPREWCLGWAGGRASLSTRRRFRSPKGSVPAAKMRVWGRGSAAGCGPVAFHSAEGGPWFVVPFGGGGGRASGRSLPAPSIPWLLGLGAVGRPQLWAAH